MVRSRAAVAAIAVVVSLTLTAGGCGPSPASAPPDSEPETAEQAPAAAAESAVERGRYLVAAGACSECHTPLRMGPKGPEPDPARFLAGHPETEVVDPAPPRTPNSTFWMWSQSNTVFMGDFGTSFAINLTPDEGTGIGAWTEDIFVQTIKSGKHWGASRPILPPMPWQTYAQLTDGDLRAMYAYLRTVPPIKNRVPEAQPAPVPEAPPAR